MGTNIQCGGRTVVDELYAMLIQNLLPVLGHKESYDLLSQACLDRLDATRRQALDTEGAYANEVSQILREYPAWNFRFVKADDGFAVEAEARGGDQAMQEGEVLQRRLEEAFEKYRLVKLPGVKVATSLTRRKSTPEDDQE